MRMMETVVLMTPTSLSLDELAARLRAIDKWTVEMTTADRLVVDGGTSRAYLHRDERFKETIHEQGATSERLAVLFDLVGDAGFFLLDCSDKILAGEVLEVIADATNIVVDDDFGLTLAGNEFVALVKAGRWRSE
jgi:hypothetical protein